MKQYKLVSKIDKREMMRGTREECEAYKIEYIASWRETYITEVKDNE